MNGLAICSGIGGIELGLSLVEPRYRTVCYIEREAYAAATLVRRMEEGWLDKAPVWDDVATFDGKPWRGKVDLVTSGFPCQPWSVAGQRKGFDDERWIWPDIARIIGEVRPRFVFLENVPALASGGGLWAVLESLAALGFDAEWDGFWACECGAPHTRNRVFILAYANRRRLQPRAKSQERSPKRRAWWKTEPTVDRVDHGSANRADCLIALGNAVVPAVAALAWTELTKRIT